MPLARRVTLKLPPSSLVRLPLAFPPRASVSRPFRTLHEPFTPRVPPGPQSPTGAARQPATPSLPVPFSPLVHRRRHCRSPSPCSPTLPHTTVAFYLPPRHPPVLLPACLPACHPLTLPSRRLSASTFAPRPLPPPAYLFPRHAATRSLATVPRRVLRRATHGHRFLPPYPTYSRHTYMYTHTCTRVMYKGAKGACMCARQRRKSNNAERPFSRVTVAIVTLECDSDIFIHARRDFCLKCED